MTRPVTIKIADEDFDRMESIRDRERFPTQSDFIREALRRLIREERRDMVRKEMKALNQDPEQRRLSQQMAEAGLEEWAERVWPEDR